MGFCWIWIHLLTKYVGYSKHLADVGSSVLLGSLVQVLTRPPLGLQLIFQTTRFMVRVSLSALNQGLRLRTISFLLLLNSLGGTCMIYWTYKFYNGYWILRLWFGIYYEICKMLEYDYTVEHCLSTRMQHTDVLFWSVNVVEKIWFY